MPKNQLNKDELKVRVLKLKDRLYKDQTSWDSKGLQVAPQETEVESYVVGGIKQDVKKDTFSGFKL